MHENRKPRIALDFDGVLHSYDSGYTGPYPEDAPVPGAADFVTWLVSMGFEIHIFTARMSPMSDVDKNMAEHERAIRMWLEVWGFPVEHIKTVSGMKPAADLFVDDNGYRFKGSFTDLMGGISSGDLLKAWNKK